MKAGGKSIVNNTATSGTTRAVGKRLSNDGIISGTTKAVEKRNEKRTTTKTVGKKEKENGTTKMVGKRNTRRTKNQQRHTTSLSLVPLGYYLSLYNVIVGRSIILVIILIFKIILPHVLI